MSETTASIETGLGYWDNIWNVMQLDASVILENLPLADCAKLTRHFELLAPKDCALDIMGGNSKLLKAILERAGKPDVSIVSGDYAFWLLKEKSVADTKVMLDAEKNLPFKEASFPLVFCSFGLNYLEEEKIKNLIGEITRVLKNRGKAVILGSPEFYHEEKELTAFDDSLVINLRGWMGACGLEQVESEKFIGISGPARDKEFIIISATKK